MKQLRHFIRQDTTSSSYKNLVVGIGTCEGCDDNAKLYYYTGPPDQQLCKKCFEKRLRKE